MRAWSGAVANEFDKFVEAGGVEGVDVIVFDVGCEALEGGADDEGEDAIVPNCGEDASFVALGNPNLDFRGGVVDLVDSWGERADCGHRLYHRCDVCSLIIRERCVVLLLKSVY